MRELYPSDQELVNQGIIPQFPRGWNETKFDIARRGLCRTTPTGQRTPDGSPITLEGEIVGEMMELNRLRIERAKEDFDG